MIKDTNKAWISRVSPFAVYMLFILFHALLEPMVSKEIALIYLTPILYTAKTIAVIFSLVFFWKSYTELSLPSFSVTRLLTAIVAGGVVFILWIAMDWSFATMGEVKVFDPNRLSSEWIYPFIAVRIFGAAIVVPIFEELFWRSFILRYIIDQDFTSVEVGSFTWSSFAISSVLFGMEHNLWLAGIMAGAFYNLILYRTKNLYYCILAHGITNLLLGIYVVKTGNWQFW